MDGRTSKRVLAISSGGGHWVQLLRLEPAFDGCDVAYATVSPKYRSEVPGRRFYVIRDATRWNRVALLVQAVQIALIMLWERPDVVVSTGAAPGYFAMRLGKLLGRRTIWIDSIANVEQLSMTGQLVGRYADLWLTQWVHLARPGGPYFMGAVL
ncbi:MAG TPA: UDP-N-acetylglucosamine--LPS N-acetylglucosamine transferase [Phycisphaerae bacterium]|nr:UDP-N-acetylglucosamine--LPS N-acetylglucosamine transferase [Phycisphaerae bacterium]HOJ74442.1 UDP-N-acetylglucosamine--LPS N-acetylglucosamine transferase [Phycisphaerae bacterium]HOM52931.1 UDP-N-acetylglucosamine--LPS N-acetylglucosamine transferase [Phycisphaerae bacterium]HON66488.1 UDP-N-acetylglucosamine--LPS N-acetylglucosamine transferase [Phycisphaerae bacterium]HOQ85999.1 UDP-N-acetylglucosamine--LPS N-acetylglucosamine transferase [Phycisphaerae bacterium]